MDKFLTHKLTPSPIPSTSKEDKTKKKKILSKSSSSSFETSDDNEHGSKFKTPTKKKKLYQYPHKFNQNWFKDPVLASWIEPPNICKLHCKYCNLHLKGSKTLMLQHSQNGKHCDLMRTKTKTVSVATMLNTEKLKLDAKVNAVELRLAAFVAEHNLPFEIMDALPTLMKKIDPDSQVIKKIKCGHSKTKYLIKNALAKESMNNLAIKLQNNYFSIIIDESTDIACTKSLAVVARYYDNDQKNVVDSFLQVMEVKDASSSSIYLAIVNLLNELNVPLTNLTGFAADNCSVMMGKNSGVQARLKELNPHLFVAGCVCHSFHLCASAAAKKLPQTIEDFCSDIYIIL